MQRANSLGKTGQEEKGTTEDEMVGWNYQLSGYEFVQTQGDNKGQGKLGVQSMGLQRVGHDWTTEVNWTDDSQVNIYLINSCINYNQVIQNNYKLIKKAYQNISYLAQII